MSNFLLRSTRNVPVIGDSIARIGQVVDIVSTPCSPDPLIMVTALWHDLPKLLVTLTKPDTLDLAADRAGIRHKRRPKKGFNIFDALESTIPMPKGKVGTAVFRLGNLAERLGFYMLVVDATEQFVVNWTSTVYEWSGCSVPGTPYAQAAGGEFFYQLDEGINNTITPFGSWEEHAPFYANNSTLGCPAGYDSTLSAFIRWRSEPGTVYGKGNISSIEVWDELSDVTYQSSPSVEVSPGNFLAQFQVRSWNLINPAHQYRFRAIVDVPGWFTFEGSLGSLYGHKDRGMLPDP